MGENDVAKLWKRKCYVLVFAEGGTHLICFLNKAFHSWRPMDIWSYTRMVYASISSLLPNILLIDVTLLCWFRTCCTEKTKRKKDTENNKCHSLNLKKKRENFHYLKRVGLTCEMPWLHHVCVLKMWKSSAHSGTVQCGKPMFTYLGEDFISVWSVACTCIPQAPSISPREKLFIYLFIGLKTAKKKKKKKNKHRGKKAGFRQEYIKWHWVCFMVLFFKLLWSWLLLQYYY